MQSLMSAISVVNGDSNANAIDIDLVFEFEHGTIVTITDSLLFKDNDVSSLLTKSRMFFTAVFVEYLQYKNSETSDELKVIEYALFDYKKHNVEMLKRLIREIGKIPIINGIFVNRQYFQNNENDEKNIKRKKKCIENAKIKCEEAFEYTLNFTTKGAKNYVKQLNLIKHVLFNLVKYCSIDMIQYIDTMLKEMIEELSEE